MKMRLVRISIPRERPVYALLYQDGTMLKDMNLNSIKFSWQRANRDRDVWAVVDFLSNTDHPEKLSANKYSNVTNPVPVPSTEDLQTRKPLSSICRWDITPDGDKLDDMSCWGGSRVSNLIVLDDNNRLIVNSDEAFVLCRDARKAAVNEDFQPEPDQVHSHAPLKMRLVRTQDNLREGVYLLYPDGTMDSSLSISEADPKSCMRIFDILENYKTGELGTSETGERWDTDSTDMSSWGGAYAVNAFVITADNKLILTDPSLLMTLCMRKKSVIANGETRPEYVTLKQYCDICLQLGLYDDRFTNCKNPIDMSDPEELKKRLRTEYIRLLELAKRCADRDEGKDDKNTDNWKGFPKGAVMRVPRVSGDGNKTFNTYYLKIYYPDDDNMAYGYTANGGTGAVACLPRFAERIDNPNSYKPVRLTEEMLDKIKQDGVSVDNETREYSKIDKQTQTNRSLNEKVIGYKGKGKTLAETVDILCQEKDIDCHDEAKRMKINEMVERRWGSGDERKSTILNLALENDSKADISRVSGFTENYVTMVLSDILNNSKYGVVQNSRGLSTSQEVYDALSKNLLAEIRESERDRIVNKYLAKGTRDPEMIARLTKINVDTVRQIISENS